MIDRGNLLGIYMQNKKYQENERTQKLRTLDNVI